MPDESAPLAFLEKSHCVPILLALYRKGMMNRNQLYNELGQTINIVIKRIQFLKDKGLIYEEKMNVRPFAKYIDLTRSGYEIAKRLYDIETLTIFPPDKHKFSRIHLGLDSRFIMDKCIEEGIEIKEVDEDLDKLDLSNFICPNCKNELDYIRDGNQFFWLCLKCGFRKESSYKEAFVLWINENKLVD